MPLHRTQLAKQIKAEASRLGFDACGIAEAGMLDEEARRLEAWLNQGRHGTMDWMARNFDKRVDPRLLVDDAKSVISVLHNYYHPVEHDPSPTTGLISRYAWGDDYHDVLKEKLYALLHFIQETVGEVNGRAFVDSAPVMDKAWAKRAGIGWQGKHSNLLNPKIGSYFFIGELILDLDLPPDGPIPDYCGACTRCVDACPTDAIYEPYAVDANRCISYLTIENRSEHIPASIQPDLQNWIFGCDICQDVCPWNGFKRPTKENRFLPRPGLPDTDLREWVELDLEAFRRHFRKNPVKRTKFEGFVRNVRAAAENVLNGKAGKPE
ncbi:MAG: tRNA epoxyqueuosine(34) reductase QueG [Bacteroidota bacterium]